LCAGEFLPSSGQSHFCPQTLFSWISLSSILHLYSIWSVFNSIRV
jgi:hypothetical protein